MSEYLVLGDCQRPEFAAAIKPLLQQSTVRFADFDAEVQRTATDFEVAPSRAILVIQSFPGEYSPHQFRILRNLYPLLPIVQLLGSWCEGESRNSKIWPGAQRYYAHQFCAVLAGRRYGVETAGELLCMPPFTQTVDDRLLRTHGRGAGAVVIETASAASIGVISRDFSAAQMLCDALQSIGNTVVLPAVVPSPPIPAAYQAILYDCAGSLAESTVQLESLAAQYPQVPIIALCGFPRIDEILKAHAAGVSAVISKPFEIPALRWQLKAIFS